MATNFLLTVKILFSILVIFGNYFNYSFAQTFANVSVLVKKHVTSSETQTVITVYKASNQVVRIYKATVDSSRPVGSQYFDFQGTGKTSEIVSNQLSSSLTLTGPVSSKVGVYTVQVRQDGEEIEMRILILNSNAVIVPSKYSTVVTKGESVTLFANIIGDIDKSELRWRKDGRFRGQQPCLGAHPCISSVEQDAEMSKVFECFQAGTYFQQEHAIMNLIVRGCPDDLWGPTDCAGKCPRCFNGGVCSDITGLCQCAPGFSGTNCEQVHGRNVFGQYGEHLCNETGGNHSDGCKGALICYPNPFGCVCPAGYSGLDCTEECEDGKFGANCNQNCHCRGNVTCSKDTGVCEDNQCADNWKGENCQVEIPCYDGFYGDLCTKDCSCHEGENCTEVEENCERGCAVPWTGTACDQNDGLGRIDITYVKVNSGVETSVTCSARSNPLTRRANLLLQFGGVSFVPGNAVTNKSDRDYIRNNTWRVVLNSSTIANIAICTIASSDVSKQLNLEPFELPSYRNSTPLTFHNVTSSSIKVRWPAWSNDTDLGDGPIIRYEIRYRQWHGAYYNVTSKSSTLEADFSDLMLDTEYQFQVRVVREGSNGEGPYSDVQNQRTLCEAPSTNPGLELESEAGSRSASFSIEIPDSNTWRCSQITVELQKQTPDGTWQLEEVLNSNSSRTEVENLIPCSSYYFRIRISNSAGSLESNVLHVGTAPEAFGPVRNLRVSGQGVQGQLTVSWNSPNDAETNCQIDSYTVRYRFDRYPYCSYAGRPDEMEKTVNSSVLSYVIRNLKASAYYDVTVDANGQINGPDATQEGLTAEAAPSDAPNSVRQTLYSTSKSLRFSWSLPPCESRNGAITRYHYRLTQVDGNSLRDDYTSQTFKTFNGLIPYTEYSFTVSAWTSVGEGPFSTPETERTAEDRPPQLHPPGFRFANTSVIKLQWMPPDPPHGRITQYDISYGIENENNDRVDTVTAEVAGEPPSYVLLGLEASAKYSVKVRAHTRIGSGPYSDPAVQITEEGLPEPPVNLNVTSRTQNTLTIEWDVPLKPNGKIIKYEVKYEAIAKPYDSDFSEEPLKTKMINSPKEANSYLIASLEPSTVYMIAVSAYTSVGRGNETSINGTTALFTELVAVNTDTVTARRDETTATILLPALRQTYATGYRIRIRSVQSNRKRTAPTVGRYEDNPNDYIAAELDKQDEDRPFMIGDGITYGGYFNAPLEKDKQYEMILITVSKVGEEIEEISSKPVPLNVEGSSVLIVILILLTIAALLLVAGIVWYKRRDLKRLKDDFWQAYEGRKGDSILEVPNKAVEIEMAPTESLDNLANQDFNHPSPGKQPGNKKSLKKIRKGVKIADLASYVKRKKMSEKDSFVAEYEMLPQGQLYPWDVASKPENKTKNRYGNIIPCKYIPKYFIKEANVQTDDQSRVILPLLHDKPHSDYINASYIDGYECPNKYIACHGPNKASVVDFWRMVWQENCGKIVMLTNLSEGGKKKCEKYWPDDAMKYGDLKVVCKKSNTYPTCAVKTFALSPMDDDNTVKHVRHFHFTAWPDMKVPDYAGPLLDFLQLIREEDPYQDGPLVVHCSAGVGRTGTFITLDAMLDMADTEERVNVFQFVSQMRERRIKMVQVVEQYQFIFDALVEYFVIGNTSLQSETFRSELTQLKRINRQIKKSNLQEQFETLQQISITPSEEKFSGGKKLENRNKNRFHDRLPVDSHRPYLMTEVGSRGNNYINASFLSGVQQKDMFLATQMPLKHTILDFWRMVWDYNSPAIVMLNYMNESLEKYWPESGTFQCDPFVITTLSCHVQQGVRCRKLEIDNTSQKLERPKKVMQLQCLDWPDDADAPESPHTLLQAINMLTQWTSQNEKGPITVHCIDGVGRTGVFCCLVSALDQLKLDDKADVFQILNKMRNCRPNMVDNFEQYQSIFDMLLIHLEEDDIYENFNK